MNNDEFLNHLDSFQDVFGDFVKGIFIVKRVGHQNKSIFSKMDIEKEQKEYAKNLCSYFFSVVALIEKIKDNKLGKIIFELEYHYLIMGQTDRKGNGTQLIFSIITDKSKDLKEIEYISEELIDSFVNII